MAHRDPDPTDESADEPAPLTRDAITPRGGFMARPGLKAPPRHAVVIRGGDVEPSENIPIARSSYPPPPPASVPPSDGSSDKATLRAIPTPKSEAATQVDLSPPPPAAVPLESLPPPSDMPVVASVPAPDFQHAESRRRVRSYWTVAVAAAAGLLLGLASIAATRWERGAEPRAAAAPLAAAESTGPGVPAHSTAPTLTPAPVSALPSSSSTPDAFGSPDAHAPSPAKGRQPAAKRSIF